MAKKGRPSNPQKKCKLHISIDYEVYEYLKTLENKSEFINKAAWILFRAYKKAGDISHG